MNPCLSTKERCLFLPDIRPFNVILIFGLEGFQSPGEKKHTVFVDGLTEAHITRAQSFRAHLSKPAWTLGRLWWKTYNVRRCVSPVFSIYDELWQLRMT